MKIGQTGILTTEQGQSARIKLECIDESKSGLFPADYWFSYPEAKSERDKPVVHPDFGKSSYIKHELALPEPFIERLIDSGYLVWDDEDSTSNTVKESLEFDHDNQSEGETANDLEATIADQLRRFTTALAGTRNPLEDFKIVVSLGLDLMKSVGNRVCEDTSYIFSHIVREINPDMVQQFQQISNKCNNNDVCSYLYLCLPTLGGDYSKSRIEKLCIETIDKISEAFNRVSFLTNSKSIDVSRIRTLYLK